MQAPIQCPECRETFETDVTADKIVCEHCQSPLPRTKQVEQILERWYYPRRWFRDVTRPSLSYLVEMLWTANGQGERLYAAVSPPHVNYNSFVHQVTRTIIRGIDDGWATIELPEDPFEDDPLYKLSFANSDRFADAVAALYPNVDWDETIAIEQLPKLQETPQEGS